MKALALLSPSLPSLRVLWVSILLLQIITMLPFAVQAQESESGNGKTGNYFAIVQAGQLLYNTRQEVNGYKSSTQIDLIQGIRTTNKLDMSIGLGAGLAVFEVGYLFPVYADWRGEILKNRKFSPHYYAQLGFTFEGFPEGEGIVGDVWHSNYQAKGGLYNAFGFGIRIRTAADYDWIFSAGVRNFRITERDEIWGGGWTTTHLAFKRLSIAGAIRF